MHIWRFQVFSLILVLVYLHAPCGSGCAAINLPFNILGPKVCLPPQRARSQSCRPVPQVVITHREQAPLRIACFPNGFQHFQQLVMLSSVDDQMRRSLNCKCKSEGAGPWRGHGLEREWAQSLAPFCSEMFIFTRFLKGLSSPAGGR